MILTCFIATTPVNVFYTSGLPTTHVAPNPILYVLSNQFPNITLIRRDGEEHFRTLDVVSKYQENLLGLQI